MYTQLTHCTESIIEDVIIGNKTVRGTNLFAQQIFYQIAITSYLNDTEGRYYTTVAPIFIYRENEKLKCGRDTITQILNSIIPLILPNKLIIHIQTYT